MIRAFARLRYTWLMWGCQWVNLQIVCSWHSNRLIRKTAWLRLVTISDRRNLRSGRLTQIFAQALLTKTSRLSAAELSASFFIFAFVQLEEVHYSVKYWSLDRKIFCRDCRKVHYLMTDKTACMFWKDLERFRIKRSQVKSTNYYTFKFNFLFYYVKFINT